MGSFLLRRSKNSEIFLIFCSFILFFNYIWTERDSKRIFHHISQFQYRKKATLCIDHIFIKTLITRLHNLVLTQQFLFLAAHPSCTAAHRIEAFLISFLSEFSNTLALPAGPDLAFIFLYFCLRHSIIRLLKREKLRFVIYIFFFISFLRRATRFGSYH